MKNLLLIFTIGIIMSAESELKAATIDRLPIINIDAIENERILHLQLANLLEEVTYVEIVNEEGQILYKETIRAKQAYAKNVKLDNLPDGKYKVHVEHERIDVVQPIVLHASSNEVFMGKRIEKVAPTMEYENRVLLFQLAPTVKVKKVNIAFLDGEELVYENTELLNDFDQKQYKLDNFSPGNYTFRVIVDDKIYYKKLQVK